MGVIGHIVVIRPITLIPLLLGIRKALRNSLLRKALQVEDRGLEPLTFWLPARRSPN